MFVNNKVEISNVGSNKIALLLVAFVVIIITSVFVYNANMQRKEIEKLKKELTIVKSRALRAESSIDDMRQEVETAEIQAVHLEDQLYDLSKMYDINEIEDAFNETEELRIKLIEIQERF